ncbi:hypothetical protein BRD17_06385 [Halobacteriales archaeon SW_7_68_16]|nr:MAG: hypothetical protein BRD17_06385 [Halobacteriales archaeon SW_7_68_16]
MGLTTPGSERENMTEREFHGRLRRLATLGGIVLAGTGVAYAVVRLRARLRGDGDTLPDNPTAIEPTHLHDCDLPTILDITRAVDPETDAFGYLVDEIERRGADADPWFAGSIELVTDVLTDRSRPDRLRGALANALEASVDANPDAVGEADYESLVDALGVDVPAVTTRVAETLRTAYGDDPGPMAGSIRPVSDALRTETDGEARRALSHLLLDLAQSEADAVAEALTVEELVDVADTADGTVARRVLYALAELAERRDPAVFAPYLDTIVGYLDAEDDTVRSNTLYTLRSVASKDRELVADHVDPDAFLDGAATDPAVPERYLYVLCYIHEATDYDYRERLPEMVTWLEDDDQPDRRARAADLVKHIAEYHPEAVAEAVSPALAVSLVDENEYPAKWAMWLLYHTQDARPDEVVADSRYVRGLVESGVEHPASGPRHYATPCLAGAVKRGAAAEVATYTRTIGRLVTDPDEETNTRVEAIDAIGRLVTYGDLSPGRVLDPIVEAILGDDDAVTTSAGKALGWVLRVDPDAVRSSLDPEPIATRLLDAFHRSIEDGATINASNAAYGLYGLVTVAPEVVGAAIDADDDWLPTDYFETDDHYLAARIRQLLVTLADAGVGVGVSPVRYTEWVDGARPVLGSIEDELRRLSHLYGNELPETVVDGLADRARSDEGARHAAVCLLHVVAHDFGSYELDAETYDAIRNLWGDETGLDVDLDDATVTDLLYPDGDGRPADDGDGDGTEHVETPATTGE